MPTGPPLHPRFSTSLLPCHPSLPSGTLSPYFKSQSGKLPWADEAPPVCLLPLTVRIPNFWLLLLTCPHAGLGVLLWRETFIPAWSSERKWNDVQGLPCPANGLYLQNYFSRLLDLPAAIGPPLLRGRDDCLGPLGSPSDSSADLGGDSPWKLPLSSLQEKGTHFHFSPMSSIFMTNNRKWTVQVSSYKGSGPGIWGCGSSGNSSGLAQATILLALGLKMPVRTPPRPGWVRAGKHARASQGRRVVSLGDGRAAGRRGAPCTRLCGPQREGPSEGNPASTDTHETHVPVQCCTRATAALRGGDRDPLCRWGNGGSRASGAFRSSH